MKASRNPVAAAAVSASLLLAACGDPVTPLHPFGSEAHNSSTLYLNVEGVALAPTDSTTLSAHLLGPDGGIHAAAAAWVSDDSTVATVSSEGVVHARGIGSTTVWGAADGQRVSALVSVVPSTTSANAGASGNPALPSVTASVPAKIVITSGSTNLLVGQVKQFEARVFDASGAEILHPWLKWSASPSTVAWPYGANELGNIRAVAPGTGSVTVSTGTGSATVKTTVVVTVARDTSHAPVASVSTVATVSKSVGGAWQLYPVASGSVGQTLYGRTFTYSSSDPTVASVTSGGLIRALKVGTAIIVTACEGKADSTKVAVTDPAVPSTSTSQATQPAQPTQPLTPGPTAPVPPASTVSVPLSIRLLDSAATGAVTVSNGIPLAPGMLMPSKLGAVRILVSGTEVPTYVEALGGQHKDGSVRSILVQFSVTVQPGLAALPVQLSIGQARSLPSPAKVAVHAVPQAAALPVSPTYLISTNVLMAPTVPLASTPTTGPFRQYESDFLQWTKVFAQRNPNPRWNEVELYDMPYNHYAYWVRTGDAWYWERATRIVAAYRRDYLEANHYSCAVWLCNMDGVTVHYWTTGDTASKVAVQKVADYLDYSPASATPRWHDFAYGNLANEGRMTARILSSQLLAWELNPTSATYVNRLHHYMALLPGRIDSTGLAAYPNLCMGQKSYMEGMVQSAVSRIYDDFEQDPKLLAYMKKALDYVWTTSWQPGVPGFSYYMGPVQPYCAGTGAGTDGATDGKSGSINGLNVGAFSWYYARTGDRTYLDRAEQIFAATVKGTYLTDGKQFAQGYYDSWTHLYYRTH